MIKLSPRLLAIANYIEDEKSILDIGCDHALLDIYLAQTRDNLSIIASDVNPNALKSAQKNIKKYHVETKITLIESKGLDKIDTKATETIVISGMGSHTIVGILYNHLKKLKNIKKIILQSNNDLDFLREKVTKIGYYIESEQLVSDNKIIYTIIVLKKGWKFYSKKELYLGPILMKKKEKIWLNKLKSDLGKLEKIYPLIPKNKIHHKLKIYLRITTMKKILKQESQM